MRKSFTQYESLPSISTTESWQFRFSNRLSICYKDAGGLQTVSSLLLMDLSPQGAKALCYENCNRLSKHERVISIMVFISYDKNPYVVRNMWTTSPNETHIIEKRDFSLWHAVITNSYCLIQHWIHNATDDSPQSLSLTKICVHFIYRILANLSKLSLIFPKLEYVCSTSSPIHTMIISCHGNASTLLALVGGSSYHR